MNYLHEVGQGCVDFSTGLTAPAPLLPSLQHRALATLIQPAHVWPLFHLRDLLTQTRWLFSRSLALLCFCFRRELQGSPAGVVEPYLWQILYSRHVLRVSARLPSCIVETVPNIWQGRALSAETLDFGANTAPPHDYLDFCARYIIISNMHVSCECDQLSDQYSSLAS